MEDVLKKYINAACEVKTMDNDLLFPGRLKSIRDDGDKLTADIVSADGEDTPRIGYDFPVKIHFFSTSNGILILGGRVFISQQKFWRISNIVQYQNFERRGFFRVSTSAEGLVSSCAERPESEPPESYPVRLINISLSGVLFASPGRFDSGEKLRVFSLRLGEDSQPFTLYCRVLYADEESAYGRLYRCIFVDFLQRESDRLCKAIFSLQREELKKRRDRR